MIAVIWLHSSKSVSNSRADRSLSCDGGPLANSAHDPRWGRISETYGEVRSSSPLSLRLCLLQTTFIPGDYKLHLGAQDPYLITRMAVTANRAMQLPLQDATGRTFLKTSQTTRHYIGYHQSNQMHEPAITVTERDLRDQFLPAYEAMQVNGTAWDGMPGGRAEAIMCSYASFDGIPSCACVSLPTQLKPLCDAALCPHNSVPTQL